MPVFLTAPSCAPCAQGTWHLLCGLVVLLVYLLLAYVHQQKFGLVVMGLSALYFQRPLVASLLLQSWPLGFVAAANLLWAFALQVCFLGLYGCGTWIWGCMAAAHG